MDMKKMMRQAQKMQQEMMQAQEEVAAMTVESTAGGGAVKVVAKGDLSIESVNIDPDAVDTDDIEMLEDMVLSAVNDALKQAQDMQNNRMSSITGGMGLPF